MYALIYFEMFIGHNQNILDSKIDLQKKKKGKLEKLLQNKY